MDFDCTKQCQVFQFCFVYIECLNVVFPLFLCVQFYHSVVVDDIQPHERMMFHWEQRYVRVITITTTTAAAAAAAATTTSSECPSVRGVRTSSSMLSRRHPCSLRPKHKLKVATGTAVAVTLDSVKADSPANRY